MIHILIDIAGGFTLFAFGVLYGSANPPSVGKAIVALQDAERKAAATLATITAHKAS